jgi:Bacterial antitoxin of type II TA system, VapB
MRTTVTLDDELLKEAMKYSGITETSRLMNEAMRRLVANELKSRVLALEGSMPNLEYYKREPRMGREVLPKKIDPKSDA